MSETANLNVDSETGSLDLTGSRLESISCLESRPRLSHPWFLQRTLKLPRGCTSWPRPLVPARLSQVFWDGERDVDELVAAAVEAVEGDVTDHDLRMDLIQMIQEVFDQMSSRAHRHCRAKNAEKAEALNTAKAESSGDTHSRETRQ